MCFCLRFLQSSSEVLQVNKAAPAGQEERQGDLPRLFYIFKKFLCGRALASSGERDSGEERERGKEKEARQKGERERKRREKEEKDKQRDRENDRQTSILHSFLLYSYALPHFSPIFIPPSGLPSLLLPFSHFYILLYPLPPFSSVLSPPLPHPQEVPAKSTAH